MVKIVILCLAVITVAVLSQTHDEAPLDWTNVNFNEYYLYTMPFTYPPIKLSPDNLDVLTNRVTVVVIHGHRGTYQSTINYDIASGILGEEDANVIILDWSVQAGYSYSNADAAVPTIGSYLADFLSSLKEVEVTPDRMHIVGFDLGAHIAGHAGRTLDSRGTPVARITALDPTKSSNKLVRTDAAYVEVIHTNGGLLGDGLDEQLGDADFYPNGGRAQPGCLLNSCCHNRAWQLFSASLGRNKFTAHCCNSATQMILNLCRGPVQEMGNNKLIKIIGGCASGIYRVNTKASAPY